MAQGSAPETAPPRRRSRTGLFLPYILLLVLALVWTGGWFFVRGRAEAEMDAWFAREAAAGRAWSCRDRTITGYPFRLELRCASVGLTRSDGRFGLGPVTAVVQVYQPRHALVEATGPFHVEQHTDGGDLVGDIAWTSLKGSFHGASDGFVRASLVLDAPQGRVTGGAPEPIDFSARHLELHARPTPGRFESEGAVDVSLRLAAGAFPQLDALLGNADPTDGAVDATVERATVLRTRTVDRELEAWRQANGRLDLTLVSLVKGPRRVQARGVVGLDAAHRPEGQIDLRAAGLSDLIGQVMGRRFGPEGGLLGNLVGGLLGGRRREAEGGGAAGDPPLTALPPLRLVDGRLMLGPFAIPNLVVPPLY